MKIFMIAPPEEATWFDLITNPPQDDLVVSALAKFGAPHMADHLPGRDSERGVFFTFTRSNLQDKGSLKHATENDIGNASYIMFTGIDTGLDGDGARYLTRYANNISGHLVDISRSIITYHYDTTPRQRAKAMEEIFHNEAYSSEEAKKVGDKLFHYKFNTADPDHLPAPIVFVTHSFGGYFQKMVLNVLSQKVLDAYHGDRAKARRFMSRFHSINFAIRPPWKSGKNGTMSPYLDIQQDGIELYITAPDDLLSHVPAYVLNSYSQMLNSNGHSAASPAYVMFRHEGDSKHKFLVLLAPGSIPAELTGNGLRNMAGHNMPHYLEALGFLGCKPAPGLASLHHIIHNVVHAPSSFLEEFRSNDHQIISHDAHSFQATNQEKENLTNLWVAQIGREESSWNQKGLKHPFKS